MVDDIKMVLKYIFGMGWTGFIWHSQAAVNKMMNLYFPKMLGISCIDEEMCEISFFFRFLTLSITKISKKQRKKGQHFGCAVCSIFTFLYVFRTLVNRKIAMLITRAQKWRNTSVEFYDVFLVRQVKLWTQRNKAVAYRQSGLYIYSLVSLYEFKHACENLLFTVTCRYYDRHQHIQILR
jgi:hypothetical protein